MPACPQCKEPVQVNVPFCPHCHMEEPASTKPAFRLFNAVYGPIATGWRILLGARDRLQGRQQVVLTIRRVCDGEVRTMEDERWRDLSTVCDCMRALMFADAGNEPRDPDSEQWGCETGALYRVTMRDRRTGRVLYSDGA